LLAVSVAIMLTATMAATIGISFRLKKEAEFAVEAVHGIQTAGDEWVKDVKSALPPNPNSSVDPNSINTTSSTTGSTAGTTGGVSGGVSTGIPLFMFGAFYGDSQNLRFYNTSTNAKADLETDVEYIEFGLEQQPDGTLALVRRLNTNLLGPDQVALNMQTDLHEEVLITNVTSLTFSYYDENGAVTDTWDSTSTLTPNSLPFGVEMILRLPGYRNGDPEREIHRFAAVSCAVPIPVDTDTTTGTTASN